MREHAGATDGDRRQAGGILRSSPLVRAGEASALRVRPAGFMVAIVWIGAVLLEQQRIAGTSRP